MSRYLVVAALLVMGLMVLYLPTRHGAGEYRVVLMMEQERSSTFWDDEDADRIMQRAQGIDHRAAAQANTVMPAGPAAGQNQGQQALARAGVNLAGSVLHNNYTRAFGAQFVLAFYRACTVLQVLPLAGVLLAAAVMDGATLRLLKSLRFKQHNAEVFGLCVLLSALALCMVVVLLVWPRPLPAPLLPCLPLLMPSLAWWGLANYHRRAYPPGN
ncbi:DUF4400 domain-containing protein [Rugamonas aquatica]|uniref:DUF4400 domain-containing protein n=1 Tax=Rugamonas aquatica TaxID=2743357 RepID=A0A6A7N697_9BURK|nr:DUF4400 domain-containing protein [Rugamonas aquatica]MQA40624.1 DUF4400 domain-containing protein [Rugamonas aquatica]